MLIDALTEINAVSKGAAQAAPPACLLVTCEYLPNHTVRIRLELGAPASPQKEALRRMGQVGGQRLLRAWGGIMLPISLQNIVLRCAVWAGVSLHEAEKYSWKDEVFLHTAVYPATNR